MVSRLVEPVLTKSTAYLISWRFQRSRCRDREMVIKSLNEGLIYTYMSLIEVKYVYLHCVKEKRV